MNTGRTILRVNNNFSFWFNVLAYIPSSSVIIPSRLRITSIPSNIAVISLVIKMDSKMIESNACAFHSILAFHPS